MSWPLSSRLLVLALSASALWLGPAASCLGAEQGTGFGRCRVVFRTGRKLAAASVSQPEDQPGRYRIELQAGGSVIVSEADVARLEPVAPEPQATDSDPADSDPVASAPATCPLLAGMKVARWDDLIEESAQRHALDANLVRALIAVESAGDPAAVSRKGAVGLMQLLPRTAAEHGCSEPTDPAENIEAGCRHLARLLKLYPGRMDLVLAAYNAGEGAVQRAGGVPSFRETQRYVRDVLDCLGSS